MTHTYDKNYDFKIFVPYALTDKIIIINGGKIGRFYNKCMLISIIDCLGGTDSEIIAKFMESNDGKPTDDQQTEENKQAEKYNEDEKDTEAKEVELAKQYAKEKNIEYKEAKKSKEVIDVIKFNVVARFKRIVGMDDCEDFVEDKHENGLNTLCKILGITIYMHSTIRITYNTELYGRIISGIHYGYYGDIKGEKNIIHIAIAPNHFEAIKWENFSKENFDVIEYSKDVHDETIKLCTGKDYDFLNTYNLVQLKFLKF